MNQAHAANVKLEDDKNLTIYGLENGFFVYFYPNKEPPNRISMRLVVKSGSIDEDEGQEGLAHFMEHMAFKGTKHFPAGNMIEYFQRLGMAFGADTNAHTSFNETVYKIDIPDVSDKHLNEGLKLLRDYADGMLLDESEINKERGVILAEKKSRDTAEYRVFENAAKFMFYGSKYGKNFPIGEVQSINSFQKTDFKRFYRKNYTTDNMVLVVVGDVEKYKMLDMIEAHFASMKKTEKDKDDDEVFEVRNRTEFKKKFIKEPTLKNASADIVLVQPANTFEGDTIKRHREYYRSLAISKILNMRLAARASRPDAKFTSGNTNFYEFAKYANMFYISVDSPAGTIENAYEEAYGLYLNILRFGFGETELKRAKNDIYNDIENNIKKKTTRPTPKIANEIASAVVEAKYYTAPEVDMDIAKYALSSFSAKEANKFFAEFISKSQRFIILADVKNEPLENIYEDASKRAHESSKIDGRIISSGLKFCSMGTPGKISEKKFLNTLNVTQLAFENGVRVNLKKTDFTKDEILISIAFGGGKLDTTDARGLDYSPIATMLGGTKFQTYGDIQVAKADKTLSYNMKQSNSYFSFDLKTNNKDFKTALSFARTQIEEPRYSDEAIKPFHMQIAPFYKQLDTQVEASMVKIDSWMCDNNFRNAIPLEKDLTALKMRDFKDFFYPILMNSYMEISIVGDFDEKEAEKLLAETFGSLPPRDIGRPSYEVESTVTFQSDKKLEISVNNKDDDKALLIVNWLTCDRSDVKKMRAANVLSEILSDVIRINLREHEGKVYSPFAYNNSSDTFKNFGYLSAGSVASIQYADDVIATIKKSAKQVLEEITPDQFERAKAPLLKYIEKTKRNNSYWATQALPMIQAISGKLETAETFETGYQELTLEDIKQAAKEFLDDKRCYEIKIVPKK